MISNKIEKIFNILKEEYNKSETPSVTLIANTMGNPFYVLISTLISLRTKDEITIKVSKNFFNKIYSFEDIVKIKINELEKLLYPAGFYKTKAKRLKDIAEIIIKEYNGNIPDKIEELLKLPGVGRKTANLVISLGFNKPSIAVDTHVHRISNRLGLVNTKSPEETEMKLKEIIPKKYWQDINNFLVSFGQKTCRPISPYCSKCKLNYMCEKRGVVKNR